jgi:hypothetical protein
MRGRFRFPGTRLAPVVPKCAPRAFTAGDTVVWTRTLADYPISEGWTAFFALRGASALDVNAGTASDGVSFQVTLTPTNTGNLVAGQYEWALWVKNGTQVFTVERGVMVVEPNVLTAKAGDLQLPEEREYNLVCAQIAGLLASPNDSYSIGGTTVQKRDLDQLYKLRGILAARLGRARGQSVPSRAVRFRAAS